MLAIRYIGKLIFTAKWCFLNIFKQKKKSFTVNLNDMYLEKINLESTNVSNKIYR